jgi:tetratricopeptide (TPR) repeat protein
MTEASTKIRLDLARGHWSLGELDEAVSCLERAVETDLDSQDLRALIDELLSQAEAEGSVGAASRLAVLRRDLRDAASPIAEPGSPLATGTMAQLLAEQGHVPQALAVAEQVLRSDPEHAGAREVQERARSDHHRAAIERLEHWLELIQRHKREAHA